MPAGDHAVLFDLDGVLADSRLPIAASINHALRANGFSERRPPTLLHRFIGPPLALAFGELTGRPADSASVAACVSSYREHYAHVSTRDTTAIPGMAELLAELAPRQPLGVATSKPAEFAVPILEALGLRALFDAVVGPPLSTIAEDKAATVAAALAALGCTEGVMVGDRSFDVLAARANRLRAIGVTWGIGTRDELLAAGADVVVDSPGDLAAVLSGERAPSG